MERVASQFTVADYCKSMERREIIVNSDYQRSDQVWPQVARSYLVETIIKGFPIPKLYLYQVTDVKTRKTRKEIVDGQQRSVAILGFYNNEYKLSRSAENEDLRNKSYSELDEEYQRKFLEYSIDVDLFVAATSPEVVEVFRRMNSYTVPLNAEEQRHASYQGKFKWFINELADRLEAVFLNSGVFKEKQLVRMADNKLLTELCDSLINGIRTTKASTLDSLYKVRDDRFPEENELGVRLLSAFDQFGAAPQLHSTSLVRTHMVYSLIQAVTHVNRPVRKFEKLHRSPRLRRIDWTAAVPKLTSLAQAVDNNDDRGKFASFVRASTGKTNVKENREVRFKTLCSALAE
jgi:Protein of unknown function DUF262